MTVELVLESSGFMFRLLFILFDFMKDSISNLSIEKVLIPHRILLTILIIKLQNLFHNT